MIKLSRPSGSPIILVFLRRYQIPRGALQRVIKCMGWNNWRFSIEIAVYLGNGTR